MLLLSSALLVLSAHGAIYGASRRSDWFLLAGMLLLLPVLFRWEMRLSPSPDVPLLLAPVVFGWLMLRQSEDASEQAADSMHARTAAPEFALLVFGALAASIKLSAAPLLAVGLLHYLRPRNAGLPRRLALGLGISSLILVPTVANSFRSTGCLLFPLPLSCADVAFGVGSEAAVSFKDIVRATAPWDIGGMLLLSAASLAALAPRRYALRSVDFWVIALAVAAIAFALATAPTSRFARGYLVLLPALAFSCYVGWAAQHLNRSAPARWLIAPAIALALLAPLYKELFRPEGQTLMEAVGSRARGNGAINAENGERWLWPNRLAYRGPVRVARSNDVTYAVSLEGTCWNQPIPCLSNPEAPLALPVRLRHPASGLAGGFVRP
jgi:hypothetical protein